MSNQIGPAWALQMRTALEKLERGDAWGREQMMEIARKALQPTPEHPTPEPLSDQQASARVASIAIGAAGKHAERVIELEAEVSTLREHLAEQNRLLSLNVAEVERLRDAHAEPQWLSDPERDEVIDVLSKVLCLPAGSMSDEEAKEEGREVCERLQRHRSTAQPPPVDEAEKLLMFIYNDEFTSLGQEAFRRCFDYYQRSAPTKGGE